MLLDQREHEMQKQLNINEYRMANEFRSIFVSVSIHFSSSDYSDQKLIKNTQFKIGRAEIKYTDEVWVWPKYLLFAFHESIQSCC